MTKHYDVVIIGTGTAASAVASRCRSSGWSVAGIDSRPFGGTCALRGCDPKKVLVGAAEVIDSVRRLNGKAIRTDDAQIDWPRLMAFKRSIIEDVPRSREEGFVKRGIDAFHGRAKFIGPTTISIGSDVLEGRYVVVAAGAQPADLGIAGAEYIVTSERFLELDRLPPRIIFIGGGYISFEFAHVSARAGAHVTILHRGERPLESFDPDLVGLLAARTRELGAEIHIRTEVTEVEKNGHRYRVSARTGKEVRGFDADLVVHGAGRVAEIDDMDLDAASVEWDRRGVKVNPYLQSVSNPAVYAAGDAAATGGPRLTPVAAYEGQIVATNLLEGNRLSADYSVVPSVVFTLPPLATVGLHEQTARDRGLRFKTKYEQTGSWQSSRRIGESASGFKVLVEEDTGRIVGAHLLGPHADEVINLFAIAMRANIPAAELKSMLLSYPTNASDVAYMV